MPDKNPSDVDLLLVHRDLFLKSLLALEHLIQATAYNYQQVQNSRMDKDTRAVILQLLQDQIMAATQISSGFEMSVDTFSETPSSGGTLN